MCHTYTLEIYFITATPGLYKYESHIYYGDTWGYTNTSPIFMKDPFIKDYSGYGNFEAMVKSLMKLNELIGRVLVRRAQRPGSLMHNY